MECQVVLRSLDRAGIYLHLSCWRSPSDLFGALHTDTAGVGFHELGRLAALEPGQAVPVGLMGAGLSLGEAAHVLLVRVTLSGSAPAFELQFGALAGQFLYTPGFGGGLLLRSTLDPRGYLGLIWWSSARSCDDALRGARSQERRRQLLDLTDELAFERAQVVADDA
jgi:heme-degrading monooxygenase HmoA